MSLLRKYINIIESANTDDEEFVYHGGTYTGGEYNPNRVGEPGNIRPLGKGIYAATTPEHAQRYVKYAGPSGKVQKFRVSKNAKLYPWGGAAWQQLSPEQAEWWRAKAKEVQDACEEAGLVKYNTFRKEYYSWIHALSGMNEFPSSHLEQLRKLLVSHGIDGSRQVIGDLVELVFYNTSVLQPVNDD